MIQQYYDAKLLSGPAPKLRDTCTDLWTVYLWIKTQLMKKAENNPIRLKKLLELENQFLELYERAKAKEKEREEQKDHCTQGPFYRFKETGRNYRYVFRRLRSRSSLFRYSTHRKDD